jgi:hypothetical protein
VIDIWSDKSCRRTAAAGCKEGGGTKQETGSLCRRGRRCPHGTPRHAGVVGTVRGTVLPQLISSTAIYAK